MIFKPYRKLLLGLFSSAAIFFSGAAFGAELPEGLEKIKADSWSVVGKNITVSGGVHIPYDEWELYADEAVVNIESRDVEAYGNIRFYRWERHNKEVSPSELAKLRTISGLVIGIDGLTGDNWGNKRIKINGLVLTDQFTAQRMVGNLDSGYFRFDNFAIETKTVVCAAKSAERFPNGRIEVHDAEFSSCEYLHDHNAHYSVSANKAVLTPHASDLPGLKEVETTLGEYTITMYNGFVKVYGVPLLWLPAFYKPRDENLGICQIQFGKGSSWGYYVSMSRNFEFSEYPESYVRTYLDYYNLRGWGVGARANFATENSRTELFAYGIYDLRPNENDDYRKYRIEVPHWRFNLRLSNVTHITPRLDFRGVINYSSDPYLTKDFFSDLYARDSSPATYAALEQQFDHFSASIYFRPRLNNFYSTVEKLPEVRIDVHRQELFGTNVYYQGATSAGYDKMEWIHFNRGYKVDKPEYRLRNYESFRLSTTHFIYYPIRTDWFTLVPRAGMKFIAYSKSSKNPVYTDDLVRMFEAAQKSNIAPLVLNSYDNKGGSQVRLAGELGFELSTKIHNTWLDVRNSFLKIDGLRHVIRPYINYTYIDVWGASRNNVYYFDDEDRIQRQNFIRFGLENHLQTRTGGGMRNYLSMENYWDFHFETGEGFGGVKEFSRIGNICTILTASPFKGFSISTSFAIDPTNQNGEVPDTIRKGKNEGKVGLNCRWLNRWNISISYEPIEDIKLTLAYSYNRPYAARSSYSMGSTLTNIDSGGYFDRYYGTHNETFSATLSMPLTPDRRTYGAASVSYDVQDGNVSDFSFYIARKFHCVELSVNLTISRNNNDSDSNAWDTSYSFQLTLMDMDSQRYTKGNTMLSKTNGLLPSSSRAGSFFN